MLRMKFKGPLRSGNFRLLMASNVVSLAGSAICYVAIPFAVLRIGGSASDVGYVAAARLVPSVAFLLVGGTIADRVPRHQMMVVANVSQAAAQGASAAFLLTGHATVWLLAVLAAATGVGSGLYFPASEGLLPQTVAEDQRAQANALDRTGQNIASTGGAAAGGILVGAIGPGWGLVADAASFAIAAAMRAGMQFPSVRLAQHTSILHDLKAGWREFICRRWLWATVLQLALVTTIATAVLSVLGPLVAHHSLSGARSWGFIAAAYAAGAAFGGAAMLKYRPQRMLLLTTLCQPAWCVLLFALAVPLVTPGDAAAALLAGFSSEVGVVLWVTIRQQEISVSMLSRISSYDIFGRFGLAPVGTVIAGPLASVVGTSTVLTAGGILILGVTGGVALLPEVRNLRRR
jgi:MFS family permease